MADQMPDRYERRPLTFPDAGGEKRTRDVWVSGDGPGVLVMTEVPGISPEVIRFADRLVDRGMSVWLPHLFGEDGRPPTVGYIASTLARNCVSRDFAAFATGTTSPVIVWLRHLATHIHAEQGGPGIGAVGMCWTGGFALGLMVEESVIAPVLSQPSLPLPISGSRRRDIGLSPADRDALIARADAGVCVLGLRFTADPAVPAARFETLRALLGDNFIGVEIDSSKGNPHGNPKSAHSVLTEHLVDEDGHPTRAALDQVLDFFSERLLS
jgi:dienelactone hydrolase